MERTGSSVFILLLYMQKLFHILWFSWSALLYMGYLVRPSQLREPRQINRESGLECLSFYIPLFSARYIPSYHPVHATAMRNGSMLAFSSLVSPTHGSCIVSLNLEWQCECNRRRRRDFYQNQNYKFFDKHGLSRYLTPPPFLSFFWCQCASKMLPSQLPPAALLAAVFRVRWLTWGTRGYE